ncbi:MAG: site-2 protease family protein [Planctomycetota bacterium]
MEAVSAVRSVLEVVFSLGFLEVLFGVSFLILFHEFGHFVVARLAGVRVETFSLGFGPRLFGWRRGPTDYRVSAVPLGGYVKLAGEAPGGEGRSAPDELASKGARWRAAIFLAGIVFNALLTLILFPILFATGVPFLEPLVGETAPGGPAWRSGLDPGTRILSINETPIYSFEQIRAVVALADSGEGRPLRMRVRSPEGEEKEVEVFPEWDAEQGFRVIHVNHAADREHRIDVEEGSPAALAGLKSGDRLISLNATEGEGVLEGLLEELGRATRAGEPLRLQVLRRGEEEGPEAPGSTLEVEVQPRKREVKGFQVGIAPLLARVKAVREPLLDAPIREGDRLLAIDGRAVLGDSDLKAARASTAPSIVFTLERDGGEPYEVERPTPSPREREGAIAALALASEGTRVVPVPGLPADRAGIAPGDRIVSIDGKPVGRWEEIFAAISHAGSNPIRLEVERGGRRLDPIRLEPVRRAEFEYGLQPRPATHIVRAPNLAAACALGWRASVGEVQNFVLAVRRMVRREMSASNLSGIVSIVSFSYRFTQISFAKFLFFLGVLSVNLALINLLPIPLLDGGHLLFLAIEKVKGSPLSERALTIAQVAGLVVIGGLVLFVTWNDIDRMFL